ncbi:MAG TPA: ABC transporter permease [Candidatus Fermentibacter daniensis]|nr:ABC transporter permease [Candidatus Fermentibacter daniensis]HOG54744.1 ABC transporter permease [Candidatus Fermentibacter daniensis]HOH45893.1 ABC transporter permease [Syntrophales bacterium]HQE57073.1 ABC transporter permease [Candidatus Fermentibacter daniensis]
MERLAEAFGIALDLIVTGDPVVMEITMRTLMVSASATIISTLLFVPLGVLIHFTSFPGKRVLTGVIHALYSMPTVFAGLVVFLFLSRVGPLGFLGILFTTKAIVIAEVVLIAPVMLGLVIAALGGITHEVEDTVRALGAGPLQTGLVVIGEARRAIVSALLMSFGRAISEVGAAMMVGGNIAGRTRTLTTAISLGIGKGETAESIALGLILITLALLVSLAVHLLEAGRA